jgi:hypothetical protein
MTVDEHRLWHSLHWLDNPESHIVAVLRDSQPQVP